VVQSLGVRVGCFDYVKIEIIGIAVGIVVVGEASIEFYSAISFFDVI
jgi:hypothetical protein